ncbi:MAG: hypothetical protein ABJN65_05665 [Parasphingorhabdus sp.]
MISDILVFALIVPGVLFVDWVMFFRIKHLAATSAVSSARYHPLKNYRVAVLIGMSAFLSLSITRELNDKLTVALLILIPIAWIGTLYYAVWGPSKD